MSSEIWTRGGRFASAGFHLSETSSDVSHLPKPTGGGGGWGAARLARYRRDKGDCWWRRPGLFSEGREDVITRGSDSPAGYAVKLSSRAPPLVS